MKEHSSIISGESSVKPKITSRVNFLQLSREQGYVAARTQIKKVQISERLEKIHEKEEETVAVRAYQRLAETIRLSSTLGEPASEQPVDKIISMTDARKERPEGMTDEEFGHLQDNDTAVRRAILSKDLSIPQAGIHTIPEGLGDTMFLQMSFVHSLIMPRNNLTSILTSKMPQLSIKNLRYLTELNLSGNKLVSLPIQIGAMKNLTSMNLSENNIFRLPYSIREMNSLTTLDLSKNNFSQLGDDLQYARRIANLDLSKNLFRDIPVSLIHMSELRSLNMSFNMLFHMAVTPKYLTQDDMWVKSVNLRDGSDVYLNILTREKVKDPQQYNGVGIQQEASLHTYQSPENTMAYRRRKMWLSINKVPEWNTEDDVETGWIFYRNNVSGETVWDMPAIMDTFGDCVRLEVLNLSSNSMKQPCNSLCKLDRLKRIYFQKNRMHSVPDRIGDLKELEYLNVADNELKLFPPSLVECISLREIHCQGNQLMRLPDLLGTLPQLQKLDASANRMKILPPSLGYAQLLTETAFQDNPLEDPPMEEVLKGLDKLKWFLRQRYMILERGMPPPMIFSEISIMHEVTVLKPELMLRIKHMIEVNKNIGPMNSILNLQLMGLTELPKDIVLYTEIRKLRLDFNNKLIMEPVEHLGKGAMERGGFPTSFSGLRMLSIRACNQTHFPENCGRLKRLNELNLDENLIEALPKQFTMMRTLKDISLARNRLYAIPEELNKLTALKSLNLENNYLELLPVNVGKVKGLTHLNVSKNRLVDIPDTICDLKYLKKLNVESNNLLNLPLRISEMTLLELKVGHNRIELLDDELFDGPLGLTLKLFSCPENNMSELPISIAKLDPDGFLDCELNPLYSPPPGLMSEKLSVIQHYLRVRQVRLYELEEFLEDEGFEFDREFATPYASGVLKGGTGFLSPDDLIEFDKAVDEYLNGEYYKCPASGFELTENLANLLQKREDDLYSTILTTMQEVLMKLTSDKATSKLFGKAVYQTTERPWGRKGSANEPCHVIALQAVREDAPISRYHPEGRKSVYKHIEENLPPMPFPFDEVLLKDAISLFESPFGQVAEMEEITFEKCDCLNPKTGRPAMHKPCKKPAIVLLNTIYSQEEIERREEEEQSYMDDFEEIDATIRLWVQSDEGKSSCQQIMKMRRNNLKEEMQLREELSMGEQVKMKHAKNEKERVEERKKAFENNEDFETHNFHTSGEAIKALSDCDDTIEKIDKRLIKLQVTLENCEKMSKIGNTEWRRMAIDDLVQKYCYEKYAERVKEFRKLAIAENLRRPWDGKDGSLFAEWKRKLVVSVNVPERPKDDDDDDDEAEGDFRNDAEYNWDGTDDMMKYSLEIFDRFKRQRSVLGQMSKMIFGGTAIDG